MPTNAQLTEENAALRARIAELEAGNGGATARPPVPQAPSFGMSEGTRMDIELAKATINADPAVNQVTITEPGTGKAIVVTAENVDTSALDDREFAAAPADDDTDTRDLSARRND